MHIVIFIHPDFKNSQSMPRYANMLAEGMRRKDHEVEIWTAKRYFHKIPGPDFMKKWLGYIDQFILFPVEVKMKLIKCSANTLYVFADHALGPWISLVSKRPFVVHCHDFLAQRSALGEIPENATKVSGKLYQKLIRKGYKKGVNFISVSEKTRQDLHSFLNFEPRLSKVVYNGLNQDFKPGNIEKARKELGKKLNLELKSGFILHVGGNQFYKNRKGVIEIYDAWRKISAKDLPLLMIGSVPTKELMALKENSHYSKSIFFLSDISDEYLRLSYQGAFLLLFPSLEEGFGWPIAEAMASGCPVITTGEAPMTEVGGNACNYIPRMPKDPDLIKSWARYCAETVNEVTEMPLEKREKLITAGIEYAKRFDSKIALEKIESIYKEVHQMHQI